MPALETIAYQETNNEELVAVASHAYGEPAWVFGSVANTDDLKETAASNTFTFIAVAVGLLISISPLLMSMVF